MHTATIEHDHRGPAHSHEMGIGAPASSASVALDLGGGRGALIIYPSERYRGLEIEISAADGDGHRVHTGVHERSSSAGSMLTAIFGSLPAGHYVIWEDHASEGATITVTDGAVAEVNLA
ncbi:MAG: phospholipase [Solirubrobacteraceae bacterium]